MACTGRTMMRHLFLLAVVAGLAACGPSAAEQREALNATYQTDRATLWKELQAEMRAQFPATGLAVEDEQRGFIESKWKAVESKLEETDENDDGARFARPVRTVFRVMVKVDPEGPPWHISIDGEAAKYRAELSALEPLKKGTDDEPDWVRHRINSMRVAIHKRLRPYMVSKVTP
jgi:hypothetical protein